MSCNKMSFENKAEAKRYADDLKRRNRNSKNQSPYVCPRCNQWHNTSMSKVEQRRESKKYKKKYKTKDLI